MVQALMWAKLPFWLLIIPIQAAPHFWNNEDRKYSDNPAQITLSVRTFNHNTDPDHGSDNRVLNNAIETYNRPGASSGTIDESPIEKKSSILGNIPPAVVNLITEVLKKPRDGTGDDPRIEDIMDTMRLRNHLSVASDVNALKRLIAGVEHRHYIGRVDRARNRLERLG